MQYLFILITYYIIEQLYANCKGYKDYIVNLFALFFADDGLIIAQNKENAIKNIKYVNECGLKINRNKSKVLIYNNAQEIEEIGLMGMLKDKTEQHIK